MTIPKNPLDLQKTEEIRKKELADLIIQDNSFLPFGIVRGIKNTDKTLALSRFFVFFISGKYENAWPIIQKDCKAVFKKDRTRDYWIELLYTLPKELDTAESQESFIMKWNLDATIKETQWGNRYSYFLGPAKDPELFLITFMGLLRSGVPIYATTPKLATRLKSLFRQTEKSGQIPLFELAFEKLPGWWTIWPTDVEPGDRIEIRLPQELLSSFDIDIPTYPHELPPGQTNLTKYSLAFLGAQFMTREEIEAQLPLFDEVYRPDVEISIKGGMDGLGLTLMEGRVLHGILTKFSRFNYQPDTLNFTRSELYELAGVEQIWKKSKGKFDYPGRETDKVDEALQTLSTKKRPLILKKYRRYDKKKKEDKCDVARVNEELIRVITVYKDVGGKKLLEHEKEKDFKKADKKLDRYFSHWAITLNRLIKPEIIDHFRMLPGDLYKQLKQAKSRIGGRVTEIEFSFIKWLHRHGTNKPEIPINYFVLSNPLGLGELIESRQYPRARKRITDLYKLAKNMKYLTGYKIGKSTPYTADKTVDILYLNPDKFYHLKPLKEGKKSPT